MSDKAAAVLFCLAVAAFDCAVLLAIANGVRAWLA